MAKSLYHLLMKSSLVIVGNFYIAMSFYAIHENKILARIFKFTVIGYWPCSTVSNVTDCRYVSDCRSRGHEFYPGTVPYFRGDRSWKNFYAILLPSAESFKKGCCQLQAQHVHKILINCLVKLAQEKKCGQVN